MFPADGHGCNVVIFRVRIRGGGAALALNVGNQIFTSTSLLINK